MEDYGRYYLGMQVELVRKHKMAWLRTAGFWVEIWTPHLTLH